MHLGGAALPRRNLRPPRRSGSAAVPGGHGRRDVAALEAPKGQRLAAYLAPALKSTLVRFCHVERAKDHVARAVAALWGFASAFKVTIGEIDGTVSGPPEADSGNLEVDLPALLVTIGWVARAAHASVALLVDEVQYLVEEDLRALLVAFHTMVQRALPVVWFGAGLPQVAALSGEAKSYAERRLGFASIGPLTITASEQAVGQPIRSEGADILPEALDAHTCHLRPTTTAPTTAARNELHALHVALTRGDDPGCARLAAVLRVLGGLRLVGAVAVTMAAAFGVSVGWASGELPLLVGFGWIVATVVSCPACRAGACHHRAVSPQAERLLRCRNQLDGIPTTGRTPPRRPSPNPTR